MSFQPERLIRSDLVKDVSLVTEPRRVKDSQLAIESLDPLCADAYLNQLSYINTNINITALVQLGRSILPDLDLLQRLSVNESRAVLRDLGMVAASLRRHGIEPIDSVPGLEQVLLTASSTAGTVPRDTVFSYGPWNPEGHRRRKFTSLPHEDIFIESFRTGMSELDQAVISMLTAQSMPISNPDFMEAIDSSREHFELMIGAIITVRRQIPPEIFTEELRPYFDPIAVGGQSYLAPGGAQMPILLIDQILWGSDCADPTYQEYLAENIQYTPLEMRELSARLNGNESVLTRLVKVDLTRHELSPQERASMNSIFELLSRLIAFRKPHLAVAKDNFRLRSNSDLGSGGYKPDILEILIEKTQDARSKVLTLMER